MTSATASPPIQAPLPGTADASSATPAQASAAPSVPSISQADVDAASQRAVKAEKQLAGLQKKIDDGTLVREHLGKLLGVENKEDPGAVVQRLHAEVTHATTRAAEIEANAKRVLVNATAQTLAGTLGVRADAREDLALFLDMSGVEVDMTTGKVKDSNIISDRIAALKTAKPFLFDLPAAAPSKGAPLAGPLNAPQAPAAPVASSAPIVLDSMDAFLGPKSQLDAHRARFSKTQTV